MRQLKRFPIGGRHHGMPFVMADLLDIEVVGPILRLHLPDRRRVHAVHQAGAGSAKIWVTGQIGFRVRP